MYKGITSPTVWGVFSGAKEATPCCSGFSTGLTAHRGQFSLLPQLGSQLYLLGRESSANRASSAKKFVAEALAEEEVEVTDVILSPLGEGRIQVEVLLDYQGSDLSILLTV